MLGWGGTATGPEEPHGPSWLSSYVSSLVAVKSPEEIYRQQEIIVLFCETVQR